MAIAMNANICTMAIATLIPIRAVTTDDVLTGARRSLRSSLSFRQPTRVIAAPNAAPDAIAQPSRPGARYWMAFSDLSSTCVAVSWYVGDRPVAARLACCTIEEKIEVTMAAVVGSATE